MCEILSPVNRTVCVTFISKCYYVLFSLIIVAIRIILIYQTLGLDINDFRTTFKWINQFWSVVQTLFRRFFHKRKWTMISNHWREYFFLFSWATALKWERIETLSQQIAVRLYVCRNYSDLPNRWRRFAKTLCSKGNFYPFFFCKLFTVNSKAI